MHRGVPRTPSKRVHMEDLSISSVFEEMWLLVMILLRRLVGCLADNFNNPQDG